VKNIILYNSILIKIGLSTDRIQQKSVMETTPDKGVEMIDYSLNNNDRQKGSATSPRKQQPFGGFNSLDMN
jgi:hypothetical protein